jgi:nitrite reductase (NO-forming)/hydroxylamine reductase
MGLEARSVETSKFKGYEDKYAIAGAYWPPQFVIMDGPTLEPFKIVSTRGMTVRHPGIPPRAPRGGDRRLATRHPEFIVNVKETGRILLVDYSDIGNLTITTRDAALPARRRLGQHAALLPDRGQPVELRWSWSTPRSASWSPRSRSRRPRIRAAAPTSTIKEFGPVWVTSALGNDNVTLIGTDPDKHPQYAWKVVKVLNGQGGGSLFVKTHPKSRNLWVDTPLNPEPAISQSVAVYRHRQPRCRLPGAADRRLGQPRPGPEARRAAGVQRGATRSGSRSGAARRRSPRSWWSMTAPAS